jgi:hypothetical protein
MIRSMKKRTRTADDARRRMRCMMTLFHERVGAGNRTNRVFVVSSVGEVTGR